MTRPVELAPSLLAADFSRVGEQIRAAETAGANRLHLDVMDGRFVPTITMGPLMIEAARRSTQMPLDVHLMVVEPDHLLESFASAGATFISVHVEACPNLHRTLQTIRALGCRPGVAINPHTPAVMISEILHLVDNVLVMTVNPGFGGQQFLPETMTKLQQIAALCEQRQLTPDLTVDGGINMETASIAVEAGANVLVVGSAVFSDKFTVSEGMSRLRGALGK